MTRSLVRNKTKYTMASINRINIRLLGFEERKVLKSIRLNKQLGNRHVWAELLYTRDILPEYIPQYVKEETEGGLFYNTKTIFPQDDYDNMVLKAVQEKYPEAQMTSLDINTDSCIERLKKMYEGYHKEQAVVYLTPDFSQIDPSYVPVGTSFIQFRLYLDIFTPCAGFLDFFKNEGYFDNYNLEDAERIDKLLDEKLHTVHHLEELWA